MKILLLLPTYFLCTTVYAQDIIFTKGGDEIVGKVVHIGADSVTYRYFKDANGPAFKVPLQEVAHVKLMDAARLASAPEISYQYEKIRLQERHELILQAKLDAKAYYKGKGVFLTTMGSTILNPLAGFATGTLIAALPPDVEAGHHPNRELLKDTVYRNAYKEQARRRKICNAATGFGAGVIVVSILSVVAMQVGGLY